KGLTGKYKYDGLQYDYGARVYDPRVGRFLSVDPLDRKFPWYTPYQFTGNNPIQNIDLDGLEPAPSKSGGQEGEMQQTSETRYGFHGIGQTQTKVWYWHNGGLSQGHKVEKNSNKLVEVLSRPGWYTEGEYQK